MKTKQFYFGMLMAFVAMTFIACSSSDEVIAEKGKALSLDASILQALPMKIDTRAISISSDTVFAGVMHYKEVEMSTSEISRAPLDDTPTWSGSEAVTVKVDGRYFQYTIGGSGSSSTMTSASPYYFTTTSNVTANAWYPSSGAANKTTHEVLANQSTAANFKNSDFMYGSGTVSHNNLSNSITMAHKIAKVRVTVNVVNPSYLNNSNVLGVTLCGTKLTSTVGSDGNLSVSGSSASDITMHQKSATEYEACIIPQSAELTFKVNVGGTTYTSTAVASRAYAENNIYTATITITASKVLYLGGSSVAVGDYYCSAANGQAFVVKQASLSTANSKGIKPIAVVFSTATSTTDKGHGWNLGYAMALQCATTANGANGTCIWGPIDSDSPYLHNWDNADPLTTWKNNKDGYTETMSVPSNQRANYPAFKYAIEYNNKVAAPNTSSKWYLPSNGQAYDIFVKLGGLYETGLTISYLADQDDKIHWLNLVGDEKSGIYAQNKLNQYLNDAKTYCNVDVFIFDFQNPSHYSVIDDNAGEYFWLSSERHATQAYTWIFFTGDKCAWIHASKGRAKKQSYRVRSVLAF
ncbi:MAG: fimbrillin family protein [Prevotella sp.]|nr:fimbrillin family protein [Prevotella sp.]